MDKQYTNTWFGERGGKTWDKVLNKNITSILEVGCYEGQATVWLMEHFPKATLDAVDIFDASVAEDCDGYTNIDNQQTTTYEERFDNNVREFGFRVNKIKSKSLLALATLYLDNRKYDLIYIDGDHRKLPATQDMAIAIEMLNPGGIMIVDDYRGIPWLFDAVNAFSNTLDSNVFSWETTPDGEQFVIRRK